MSHFYTAKGNLVPQGTPDAWPSPTTVLGILDKRKLWEWMLRVGVEAATAKQLETSARGTRIHQACEAIMNNEMLPELQEGDALYVEGFRSWLLKHAPDIMDCEIFLESRKYKYRGRCDIVARINGELWIIDIKTGADKADHGLQLKFYEQAYFESTGEHARMGILSLDATKACGYRNSRSYAGLKEYKEPMVICLATLALYRWHESKQRKFVPVDGSLIWKS